MMTANELLNNLSMSNTENEGHIVVSSDRFITVPESLKRIAVQHDHNIETVTFDCPRYWDGIDMSTMKVYINYMRSDNYADSYSVGQVTIDSTDENIMHFDWTITRNVTEVNGNIRFIVCIKNVDVDGVETNHWNSELCSDMYVSPGMETHEQIEERESDIITQILLELETCGAGGVGAETEQGGEIFNDYENNKALAENTSVSGIGNQAGYYGFRIDAIVGLHEENKQTAEIKVLDIGNVKAADYYAVNDIIQLDLKSHFYNRYKISQIKNTDGYTAITITPLYGQYIIDDLSLSTDADDNWFYVVGKPYGELITRATGINVRGKNNIGIGANSDVSGKNNIAIGDLSTVTGRDNKAGYAASAGGGYSEAMPSYSNVHGYNLKAGRNSQAVYGEFNEVDENALLVIGNGSSDTTRSNAFTVDMDGTAKVQSKLLIADVDVGSKLYESPYAQVDELPEQGDMDKIYITPEGQYIYNLKDKDTSTENIEIWDGSTRTKPKFVNGVYEITNGAELAYIVYNGGQEGAYYKLTKDIYLNDIDKVDWKTGVANNYTPNSWYSYYNNPGFYGSIDGNGHIIYGLYFKQNPGSYVPGAYGAGLIPFVVDGKTASITNLGVNYAYIHYEGAASAFIGDLKNNATATFSKCFVGENVCIKGGSAGAFCGRTGTSAAVSLTNCYSLASAVVAYDSYTAGIAGVPRGNSTAITVNNSFNAKGAIFSSYYTNKREANNSYQSVAGTISNEKVLTLDNMQGENTLTNPDKMPNLNLLPPIYIATEGFPKLIVFACGWVKISNSDSGNGGGSINVDQTYSPESQNPQSGKAVEEAFSESFDYIAVGANLLSPESEVGYYNASLEKLDSPSMRRTPSPIEVIGGKYLYATCNFETTNANDKIYFFFIDADGVYIKTVGYTPMQTALGSVGVPSNAVSFVAYCNDASGLGIDMSNFCLSYTAKTYEEFISKRILKEDATNIEIIDKRIDEKLSTASGTSTSNKLLGKTLVCFGDSLIGNYNPPTDIPTHIANLTGMTVYNQGYGGSRAVSHSTVYDPFSFYRLVDAIVSGDFSTQEAQLNNGVPAYYADRIAQLKTIDFNTVDFIIFNHGTNDWSNTGLPLDEGGIEKPATSFGAAIRYCIDKLLTAYPHLKILPVTPIWRARIVNGDGLETDNNANTVGIYLWQYAEKTMEVAKEFHLPSLDAYYTTGINTKNAHIYLEDGLHLNETGRELLANKIAQKILLEYC